MNQPAKDTAVLIFSRSAANEAAQKGYARLAGRKGGDRLAESLIEKTLSEAYGTGLPILTQFDTQQVGDNFGERLANAIEQGFGAGYSKLIVVGTDCPSISTYLLHSVAIQLQGRSLVLGPSPDGGIYLLGISKGAYYRQNFLALPWLTATLFDAWKAYANYMQLSVHIESAAIDFDDANSIRQWLNNAPTHLLSLLFAEVIKRWKQFQFQPVLRSPLPCFTSATFFLRGPPQVC